METITNRWARLDGRTFIVVYKDGVAMQIKERKLWAQGTIYECWQNAPYWHRKHHAVSKLIKRILEIADEEGPTPT